MKNRKHFYVSNKNVLTWLMVLCMVCSAVTRIYFGGAERANLWSQIVLPITAAVLFALICLISGKERFYKTAIPVWMICIYYCFVFAGHDFISYQKMIVALYCLLMIFIGIMYTIVTSGKIPATWLLIPLLVLPVFAHWYLTRSTTAVAADGLMIAGVLCVILSLHIHADGAYHPTWGDRRDGRRVRTLAPMAQITS